MSVQTRRGKLLRQTAAGAICVQAFAVMALPLAFCCCVSMAIDNAGLPSGDAHHGDTHHGDADAHHEVQSNGSSSTGAACPHHSGPAGPAPSQSDGSEAAGCSHLDHLVMVLAGLIGTTTTTIDTGVQPPFSTGYVTLSSVDLDSVPSGVDIPPPRA